MKKPICVLSAMCMSIFSVNSLAFAETITPPRLSPEVFQSDSNETRHFFDRSTESLDDQATISATASANTVAANPLTEDLSENERFYKQRNVSTSRPTLRQYGYELFTDSPSTFAPGDDLPVSSDYLVGPGDEILVSAQGPRRNDERQLVVARDGTVVYPGIGTFSVAGMTYSRLLRLMDQRIRGGAPGLHLSVRMGKLRSLKVFVVGNVKKPGAYTLSSLADLSNAVMASGGPTKNGSLRNIQLRRNGRLITRFDYYRLLQEGDARNDVRLQPGDVIFVPPIGATIGVMGCVKSPGIYELRDKTTLRQALGLAGNIAPIGNKRHVQIERFVDNRVQVLDLDLESNSQAWANPLQDGDLISVPEADGRLTNAIFLDGNVVNPGRYEYHPGMRVRDLIRSENELKPESYLAFGLIERLMPPDRHVELISFDLSKALKGDREENKTLAPEDRVKVFYRWDIEELPKVRIAGAINRGGEFRLHPKMRVSDLIRLAGGFQDTADLSTAELTRLQVVDNQMVSTRHSVDLQQIIQGNEAADPSLEKGDYLIIKPLPNYKNYRTVKLLGEVSQPGIYTVNEGENLSDIIRRAGGLTARAYSRGAVFTRESVKRLQEQRLIEFAQRLEEDMYRSSAKAVQSALSQESITAYQDALTAKKALLESLKQNKPSGRMIVSLNQLMQHPHAAVDVPLEEGDVLIVPPVLNSVTVLGQVYNPTSLVCDRSMTVDDCLIKTGGPRENADIQGVYVVKADGSVWSDKNVSVGWGPWRKGVRGAPIEPGDTIMVPEKLAVDTSLRDFRDLTQILFQIATTTAITWGILK